LSLGQTPLANSLVSEDSLDDPEERYPLDLAFCEECALAQITESVPPDKLFRDYLYFSSYADGVVSSAGEIANRLADDRHLDQSSLVVEIASNDGYLLQFYKQRGIPVLGVEPARNIAEVAERDRGIPTISEFFGRELAEDLREEHGPADVIHANNVLAHVPDLNGVVEGFATLLKQDGVAVIEVPYVGSLIEKCEFDTIYHEHLCYFSVTALNRLFSRHGFVLTDVERLDIHGGSLRLFVSKDSTPSDEVLRMVEDERSKGMNSQEFYSDFADKVTALGDELTSLLRRLKCDGARIAAYGAAAKGSTLLNFFGIGKESIEYVVDRNPHKQGMFMPGVHIPILSPDKLAESPPDYLLLLAWNFADEIIEAQSEYRDRGGKFIVPVPKPRVIE